MLSFLILNCSLIGQITILWFCCTIYKIGKLLVLFTCLIGTYVVHTFYCRILKKWSNWSQAFSFVFPCCMEKRNTCYQITLPGELSQFSVELCLKEQRFDPHLLAIIPHISSFLSTVSPSFNKVRGGWSRDPSRLF